MARSFTWAEIRNRIRMRTNKEKSQFVTDSEINGLIEESLAVMYNKLVNTNENYFISSTTLTLVAGTEDYNLPSDFFKLKGVDISRNGFKYPMNQVPWEKRSKYQVTTSYQSTPIDYMFYGNKLRFLPVPNAGFSVILYYIPAAPVYVDDSTIIDGVSGFEKYIVYAVSSVIRAKEEKRTQEFDDKAQMALQDLVNAVSPRDFENAVTVTDVNYYDV